MAEIEAPVRDLQETLVRAVLSAAPLPGLDRPLNFPDLAFFLREDEILLSEENVAGPLEIERVRVVSADELADEAAARGEVAYLRFGPPETEDGTVTLTLQGRIATADPDRRPLGLSSVQVKFHRVDGRWEAAEAPVFLAM